MDLSSIYAAKDKYMSDKYADSSDEDNKKDICKSFKLRRRSEKLFVRDASGSNNNDWNNSGSCIAEKPSLDIKACSEKKPFILGQNMEVPALINQYLRDYQRDGVVFILNHFKEETGCILADDMGLGKTIQMIAFFSAVLRKTGKQELDKGLKNKKTNNQVFLVVAPTSVLYNWFDELNTWGYFNVGKFHRKSKEEVISLVNQDKLEIVLTTYETMRLYLDILRTIKWSAVIFDEAHRIKDPKALVSKAARQLITNCNIGLTGTPLQNNLMELWCLLDWANPHCLGKDEDFYNKFAYPICFGQRFDASKRELATARKKQQELSLLHSRWMLRRTKETIDNQLPQKYEKIVFCSLTPLQEAIYESILKLPKVKMLLHIDELCRCKSMLLSKQCCLKNFNKKKEMFPHIQLLLKLSNHAALLLPHSNQSGDQKKLAKMVCQSIFTEFPILETMYKNPNFSTMSNPIFCGKMVVLQKLINSLKIQQNKLLLFSHSTKLLDILEAYVMSRGMIYRRLDGSTSAEYRNVIVKDFNKDSSIFICLISTTAGSLGLNFTAANYVIIFDPMWNPTYDQQAQDRAYRIGQQRDVHVYRLISVGTIEENIYMRQIYKQQLANIVIETSTERRYFNGMAGNCAYHGELFGLQNMFKFSKNHNSSFAKDTFEKVKHVENDVIVADYVHVDIKTNKQNKLNIANQKLDCTNYESQATQCIDDDSPNELKPDDEDQDVKNPKVVDTFLLHPPLMYQDGKEVESDDTAKYHEKSKAVSKICPDDVLANCGVSFIHSTKSLVGFSKKEQRLSKRAITDVFWNGMNSQELANDSQDLQDSEESQDIICTNKRTDSKKLSSPYKTIASPSTLLKVFERIGSDMFIIGSTPPAVLDKQFQDIATDQGFDTVEDFASFVLSCETTDWKKLLRDFYVRHEPSVKSVSSFEEIYGYKKNVEEGKQNFSPPQSEETFLKIKMPRVPHGKYKLKESKVNRAAVTSTVSRRKKPSSMNWNTLFDSKSSEDEITEFDSDDSDSNHIMAQNRSKTAFKTGLRRHRRTRLNLTHTNDSSEADNADVNISSDVSSKNKTLPHHSNFDHLIKESCKSTKTNEIDNINCKVDNIDHDLERNCNFFNIGKSESKINQSIKSTNYREMEISLEGTSLLDELLSSRNVRKENNYKEDFVLCPNTESYPTCSKRQSPSSSLKIKDTLDSENQTCDKIFINHDGNLKNNLYSSEFIDNRGKSKQNVSLLDELLEFKPIKKNITEKQFENVTQCELETSSLIDELMS